MHNKKIIAKGLIITILLLNTPTDVIANTVENYQFKVEDKNSNSSKDNIFEDFFNNLFNKLKTPKESINSSRNVIAGSVKEITLSDGQFVPNLNGNPDRYETIRITTTGGKKLVKEDYDNLRTSRIPKIDLSNASSDVIPNGAFTDANYLIEFKFPRGVQVIGDNSVYNGAFSGCTALSGNLVIPDTVTTIGNYAFQNCSKLTGNLVIPNSVTSIGEYAFGGCENLRGTLTLSNKITRINTGAFFGCNFTGNLVLPNSLTSIGMSAFESCTGFTGDLIIPDSVTSMGNYVFYNCTGFNGTLTISNNLTSIGDSVFYGCKGLTGNLVIPDSVTSINNSAFQNCVKLTGNLVIPNSVTTLGESAFENCAGFNGTLILSDSLTSIGNRAFYHCTGLNGTLTLPDTLTSIGVLAFYGCSGFTGNLVIPNSVTTLGESAFENCDGFNGTLTLPNSLTSIPNRIFFGCINFKGDLIIPDSVVSIGESAFNNCVGFKGTLKLSNSLTTIGDRAFYNCSGFTGDLIIPNSLDSITSYSFYIMSNIKRAIIRINENDLDKNYRKNIIDNLSDLRQILIDLPYNFDTTGTWLENTDRIIGQPTIKNIVNNEEVELIDGGIAEKVALKISVPYEEDNIVILKDGLPYELPSINNEQKYIFTESGTYQIEITSNLENVSNINFTIENFNLELVEEAIQTAEDSESIEDIEAARDLVNKLPESSKKDDFQNRLDSLIPNIEVEAQNKTSNFDIYIKSLNSISLSLETSSITFDNFSGVDDFEKLNAINFTVDSSLPYQIKAYLPNEIRGTNTQSIMDKEILNIRKSETVDYKTFSDINTPIILSESESSGDDITHSLDIKLKGGIPHEKDIYKATVKLEIQQK